MKNRKIAKALQKFMAMPLDELLELTTGFSFKTQEETIACILAIATKYKALQP